MAFQLGGVGVNVKAKTLKDLELIEPYHKTISPIIGENMVTNNSHRDFNRRMSMGVNSTKA